MCNRHNSLNEKTFKIRKGDVKTEGSRNPMAQKKGLKADQVFLNM